MEPEFSPDPERPGFVIVAAIQNRQLPVTTDREVTLSDADPGRFRFPVGSATTFVAGRLTFPYTILVLVRDGDGEHLAQCSFEDHATFGPGEYVLEMSSPMKMYVRVEGPFELSSTDRRTRVDLDGPTRVEYGARSYHQQPAATITTPATPAGLRRALPYLASSLKDTSPERSFPTLRGHPPRLEFGEEFAVPDGIDPPETGVQVAVPADTASLLEVSPLVYYLGADVVPGERVRLTTDRGFAVDLGGDSLFASVKRVLEQLFTLDGVVRTEGLYPFDLYERERVEQRVDWEFDALYERPLAEQLETYLSVPHETVADQAPAWPLVANCRPTLSRATMLPFVLDELGLVRTVSLASVAPGDDRRAEVDDFVRDGGGRPETDRGPAVPSVRRGPPDEPPADETPADESLGTDAFVEVPPVDAVEQVWLGERWPLNAGKLTRTGVENQLQGRDWTSGRESRPVEIVVVCNDEAMRREIAGDGLYGDRAALPFEVTTHVDATVAELRELLARPADFFHYVGHVEGRSFVCADGDLAVDDVGTVGARGFLLNGCRSLRLGPALLDAGGVAGIVTLRDVGNRSAVTVGRHVARLLNGGYSVGGALEVVRRTQLMADQYLAIGDTRTSVVQNEDDTISCYVATSRPDGSYEVTQFLRPGAGTGLGAIAAPRFVLPDRFVLASKEVPGSERLLADELASFIDDSTAPVVVDGELCWSGPA